MENENTLKEFSPLIIVTQKNCPWCNLFKKQVLPNLKSLGVKYKVVVSNPQIRDHFNIEGYPAVVYLDQEGTTGLYLEEGYVSIARILHVMKAVQNDEDPSDNYLEREEFNEKTT